MATISLLFHLRPLLWTHLCSKKLVRFYTSLYWFIRQSVGVLLVHYANIFLETERTVGVVYMFSIGGDCKSGIFQCIKIEFSLVVYFVL